MKREHIGQEVGENGENEQKSRGRKNKGEEEKVRRIRKWGRKISEQGMRAKRRAKNGQAEKQCSLKGKRERERQRERGEVAKQWRVKAYGQVTDQVTTTN